MTSKTNLLIKWQRVKNHLDFSVWIDFFGRLVLIMLVMILVKDLPFSNVASLTMVGLFFLWCTLPFWNVFYTEEYYEGDK